jgi:hypothetical protein
MLADSLLQEFLYLISVSSQTHLLIAAAWVSLKSGDSRNSNEK